MPIKMEQAPAVKANPEAYRKLFEYLEPTKDDDRLSSTPEIGPEENKIDWA